MTDERTILYVRHGENRANLLRQLSHRKVDYSLNDRGRAQAHGLARVLREAGVTCGRSPIFTSPLRRAAETAAVLADVLGVDVVEVEGLREIDVGSLDGARDDTAWAVYHDVLASWTCHRDLDRRFPDGEDGHDLVGRFRAAMEAVASHEAPGPQLVVAHGGILQGVHPALFGAPQREQLPNCGVVEVTFRMPVTTGRIERWRADGS